MQDKSCKTPRWRMLKSQLNNLLPAEFRTFAHQNEDTMVVDVRTAAEYESGHIPGAINIDYLAEEFWDKIEGLPPEKHYLIYCRSGRRSIRTCTLMCNGGFDKSKVYNLEGGFIEWMDLFPDQVVEGSASD